MNVLERIRLFGPRGEPDHPLSEEEREGVPETTADETASLIDEFTDDRPQ
jgi:hypothetical protein